MTRFDSLAGSALRHARFPIAMPAVIAVALLLAGESQAAETPRGLGVR